MKSKPHVINIEEHKEETVTVTAFSCHESGVGSKQLVVMVVPYRNETTYVVTHRKHGEDAERHDFDSFQEAVEKYNEFLI